MERYALKSESAFEKMQEHNKVLQAEVERLETKNAKAMFNIERLLAEVARLSDAQ